jgi:hypothetical protein
MDTSSRVFVAFGHNVKLLLDFGDAVGFAGGNLFRFGGHYIGIQPSLRRSINYYLTNGKRTVGLPWRTHGISVGPETVPGAVPIGN